MDFPASGPSLRAEFGGGVRGGGTRRGGLRPDLFGDVGFAETGSVGGAVAAGGGAVVPGRAAAPTVAAASCCFLPAFSCI